MASSAAAAAIAALEADLPELLGTYLIGVAISSVFAGLLYQQAATYFLTYPADYVLHKLLILAMLAISIMAWGNAVAIEWRLFIKAPVDPLILAGPAPRYYDLVLSTPIYATVLSQLFFAVRAYIFAGRLKVLGAVLVVLWVGHLATGLSATIVENLPSGRPSGDGWTPKRTRVLASAALCVGAGVDFFLSTILAICLARSRSSSKFDGALTKFLRLTVTTGGITSGLAIVTAAIWTRTAGSAKWQNLELPFAICLPHVVGLCVCGTLNMRNPNPDASSSAASSRYRPSKSISSHRAAGGSTTGLGYNTYESVSVPFAPSHKYQEGAATSYAMSSPHSPPALAPGLAYPDPAEPRYSSSTSERKRHWSESSLRRTFDQGGGMASP